MIAVDAGVIGNEPNTVNNSNMARYAQLTYDSIMANEVDLSGNSYIASDANTADNSKWLVF